MKPLSTTRPKSTDSRAKFLLPLLLIGAGAAVFPFVNARTPPIATHSAPTKIAPAKAAARLLKPRVVRSIPHDRRAFTQGLLWHDGGFYESTGIEGRSSVRRLSYPSGKIEKRIALSPAVFGEGLTLWKDRLIQITWQSRVAYVYDRNFKLLNQWSYEGEGWGLTHDNQSLIMSDGSDVLTLRDPNSFTPLRTLKVTLNGRPLRDLNELEWIDGRIWANIWQTDFIAIINPQSGQVESYLDCSALLPMSQRKSGENVLNGIAHDAKTGRIWLTGKLWPKIFEIELQ